MMGLHPCSVHPDTMETELQRVKALHRADDFRYYAVGEIGLDYYWDTTHVDAQKEAFQRQIQWAIEMDLPIVIHNRDSAQDSVELVRQHQNGALRGVFHCFTGTAEEAHAMLDLGFYLGIGGVVTFKNTHLRETLKQAPLERIILETDAPYLAPTPHRGKRNESAYVQHVAECLAHEVYNITYEELARRTSDNARQLFRIP